MWLIIGSTAMYHWFPDSRLPKDLDLLTPAKISGNQSAVCVVDSQWHELAEEIISINQDKVFADPNILYTLKVSHAHWDIHFDKTLFDIKFLQDKGCTLNLDLYHKLIPMWETIHGKKHVNLNMKNEEFFKDAVTRQYEHDFVHECVKFNDKPMHELIRPDLSKVWCSEAMFCALSEELKAQTALEEILAVAIERKKLTKDSGKIDRFKAVKYAHKQLCTSMTKGWFARYLIINHFDLLYVRKEQWRTQLTKALARLTN